MAAKLSTTPLQEVAETLVYPALLTEKKSDFRTILLGNKEKDNSA
jgi:hypothetical protein